MQPGYPGQDPYGQQPPSDPGVPPYQDPYAPPPQPTSGQPAYGQPAYGQPYGQPPSSGQPAYGQPSYGQPGYEQSTYGQPAYGQPGAEQPYGQPTYGQPSSYPDPYAAPASGQPYGVAPGYSKGGYGLPQSNTLGLLAMILGIASIPIACCSLLTLPFGIAAVVLGYLGKGKADQGLAGNRGQATAGIVCGAIGTGLGILVFILQIAFNLGGFYSV